MKAYRFFSEQSNEIMMKTVSFMTLISFTLLFLHNCASIRVKEERLTNVQEKPSVAMRMYLKKMPNYLKIKELRKLLPVARGVIERLRKIIVTN